MIDKSALIGYSDEYARTNRTRLVAMTEQDRDYYLDFAKEMKATLSRLCTGEDFDENCIKDALPENKGIKAIKAASVIAEKNGLSGMTLDEINMEIAEVRK